MKKSIWDFEKTVDVSKYEGDEVFMIVKQGEAIGVYIIDDGWAHFKMCFHEKFINELQTLLDEK